MPFDDQKERTKALDIAVGQIEKQFGKGSIMRLGQRGAIAPIEAISTGAISIDYALGIGGMPRGRVVEIFGPESSGKTTLALQVIAEAQRGGGMAAFVDAEHALDAQYAQKLGVDLETVLGLLSWRPAAIAGLSALHGGPIEVGRPANLCVIDPAATWTLDPAAGASRSRNTPFAGRALRGRVRHTVLRGEPVVIDFEAQR